MEVSHCWMVYFGKKPIYKWMTTRGTPISGNLHMPENAWYTHETTILISTMTIDHWILSYPATLFSEKPIEKPICFEDCPVAVAFCNSSSAEPLQELLWGILLGEEVNSRNFCWEFSGFVGFIVGKMWENSVFDGFFFGEKAVKNLGILDRLPLGCQKLTL